MSERIALDEAAQPGAPQVARTHAPQPAPSMLGAASQALGGGAVQRKLAQRKAAGAQVAAVQRKVKPEDVAGEMVGREFTLSADDGGLKSGVVVIPTAWSNTSDTVPVKHKAGAAATVHKIHLTPKGPGAVGIDEYHAGVAEQATSTEAGDKKVTDWKAKEPDYAKNHKLWEDELARLEGLASKRHELLNRRLIQETQFNRFDPIVKREVDAANAAAGFKGKLALDPNLVKSMIFQESQMGTAGEHLEDPPTHPVKTRFNVGQAIDSSAIILLTTMEKDHGSLITKYHLATLRKELSDAMKRKQALESKAKRTPSEDAELTALKAQSVQNWEIYIWGYVAPGQTDGFYAAITELFKAPGGGKPARNMDYEFWIHVMVLWLFEKKKPAGSWEDAIRAYNGSGAKAEAYKTAVSGRRDSAAAATKGGSSYVPGGI